ncbi:MAG: SBBP repeat-containing protein [Blastocatellia bacterium]
MEVHTNMRSKVSFLLVLLTFLNCVASPALTIDTSPNSPMIEFSTYLGGGLVHYVNGTAVDSSGNTYVVGSTNSSDFPTTPGAYQTSYAGRDAANGGDLFVTKLDPGGSLVYSTYLGGSGYEQAFGIAVDASGNAYVTGQAFSTGFPTTPGALKSTVGDFGAVFVTKLNSTGSALIYSTFLTDSDGFGRDIPESIAVDSSGSVYLTGESSASAFATGAFQIGSGGGATDAFVMKLNPVGTAIVYYTHLGGGGKEQGTGIALDVSGNAYIAGYTSSIDFPTTPNAFKRTRRDSLTAEPFVAKLNPSGTALTYSTLLGGSNVGVASGIAIDSSRNTYIAGSTSSVDFPTTPGAFQRIYGGGQSDAFVTKLSSDGSSLVYSTYLGSGGSDSCEGITIDGTGNVYLVGGTTSNSFPVTNAVQRMSGIGLAFKSEDAATNWTGAQNRLVADEIRSLIVDPASPTILYAATGKGVFKSTDGGGNWRPGNEGLPALDILALALDPKDSTTLYSVAVEVPKGPGGGLFKSTNGGGAWGATSLGVGIFSVGIDPLIPSVVYAGGQSHKSGGVFKSTDGGDTWTFYRLTAAQPSQESFIKLLTIDPKNPSTLYAGVGTGEYEVSTGYYPDSVVKSTDGGESWTQPLLKGITLGSVAIDPHNPSTLYVSTKDKGVFKSDDSGSNFIQINEGLAFPSAESLVIDPAVPSTLYAGTPTGVFKSVNKGASWNTTGIKDKPVNLVAIDPKKTSTLYAAAPPGGDAFIANLNPTGSALGYSTYFGGRNYEIGYAIAVDHSGAASLAGITHSSDLPTIGSLQPLRSNLWSAFVSRIGPLTEVAAPKVIDAAVIGKKLVIFGENFSDGAIIELNRDSQKTSNDEGSPTGTLIGKKSGKRIGRGQSVIIQVRNSDGVLSGPFNFTRPLN